MKVLVIQANSDGRPCGWGCVEIRPGTHEKKARLLATSEARKQFDSHCCYPGEEMGERLVHVIDDAGREVRR